MAGPTILVVDDNQANLKLAQLVLLTEGFTTLTAASAEEALDVIGREQPVLILMDIQLPGMDGLELTRRLKADPSTRDIIIVAMTGYAMKGDDRRMIEAGCDGYIAKPIDTRNLGTALREYLQ